MKNSTVRLMVSVAAVVAIALTISSGALKAQSVALKVDVPFAFHAGDSMFPAGTYFVKRQGEAIRIWDGNGHAASVLCNAVSKTSKNAAANELAFNRYGNDYFLKEVRWNGYNNARGLMKTKTEMEFAKAAQREDIQLAALAQ